MVELRHLRYFIAVAEELSFRGAAERIHIDPTPLSRTIRDLEDRLGVTLFVRTPRRLQLTPAGAKLLKQARSIFIRLERTKRIVRETDARHREPLRVGVDDSTGQPRLAECLVRWRELAPDIPVELTEMRATELLVALRNEEVDAGFSFGLPDVDVIAQYPAWVSPIVALLPSAHDLARLKVVRLADLLSFPAIACNPVRHPGLRQQMEAIFRQHSVAPTIVGEANTLPGYLTRIAAGHGVGIADADHMRAVQRKDVVVKPLAESAHLITYVLYKRQRAGQPGPVQQFVHHAMAPE